MRTLRDTFDPRRNSFDVLRLAFAVIVAVSHGMVIHTGWQPKWGDSTLGDFGLDGFFMLSGFLVTRSFLNIGSLPRYAWHRFLRIMPGFWVCLLVIALIAAPVAAIMRGLPVSVPFTGEPSAFQYLFGNAGLLITQYDIAGILAGYPRGNSFNGALWTLFFEAGCYLAVAVLGVVGVLTRRRWVVPAIAGLLAVLTVLQEAGLPVLLNERIVRLGFVFLLGTLAYLYAHRIPMRAWLAAVAAAIFLVGVALFDDYRVLGAVPLAYVFFWFATCFPWPWSMRADLSYGVYIYHWPTFQLVNLTVPATLSSALFVPAGLAVLLVPAALSWYLIEKPALARKNSPFPDRVAGRIAAVLTRIADRLRARAGAEGVDMDAATVQLDAETVPTQRQGGDMSRIS